MLSNISIAAGQGKTGKVIFESEKLEKIEILITKYKRIALEFEELKGCNSKNDGPVTSSNFHSSAGAVEPSRSSVTDVRARGHRIREKFLDKLMTEGINLRRVRGKTIYQTNSGKLVGIAVATERQPDRWFLGLPENGFDHAVLLCQQESGEVMEIILPDEFFRKHKISLSRSKGQVKFNVIKRSNDIFLQVPNTNGISVLSRIGEYVGLG